MSHLIVVMGVSGAGKSVVGEALAQRLALPYADADPLHPPANVAKMKAGHPLNDADRWPWLDRVGEWLAGHRHGGGVMSCSALKRAYRDRLRQHAPDAVFVYLRASESLLAHRLADRRGHFMPASLLASQLADLQPLQPDELGVTVDPGTVDEEVAAVVAWFDRSATTGGADGRERISP